MSAENVDLVLAAVDAYNAGDMDALVELWAPDIEVNPALDARQVDVGDGA